MVLELMYHKPISPSSSSFSNVTMKSLSTVPVILFVDTQSPKEGRKPSASFEIQNEGLISCHFHEKKSAKESNFGVFFGKKVNAYCNNLSSLVCGLKWKDLQK